MDTRNAAPKNHRKMIFWCFEETEDETILKLIRNYYETIYDMLEKEICV